MALTLLHTAAVHVATFDHLRDRIAPGAELRHLVCEDWLAEARSGGVSVDLEARLADVIADAEGPVLCSCTTLGPAAARLGAVRIDQPMMQAAVRIGGVAVMAYALDSTREASRDLFLAEGGEAGALRMLDLTGLWRLFETGEVGVFPWAVARAVRDDWMAHGGDVVILAQASMAGAAAGLAELAVPVLSSPELALRHALSLT
ncbi:hypothetical protein [Pseudooceanicola sp.]|uniref:hypothetical protein n=1 Tax=Pseudooceanicola sp. TaxID=1914328 RepID=UPI0035C6B98A